MELMKEIKATIFKIKSLEKNQSVINSDLVAVEIDNERRKLNELLKIARQEKLKATCISFIGYQKAGGQAYGL